MSFSNELEKIIENLPYSKNGIIKELGIDRSSFFKILHGERQPTEAQFSLFIHFLIKQRESDELSSGSGKTELDALLESYMNERLDSRSFNIWKEVRSFISKANSFTNSNKPEPEADTGISQAASIRDSRKNISGFISRELSSGNSMLDFYMSPVLINLFHLYDHIGSMLPYKPVIRQILGIYKDEDPTDDIAVMLNNLVLFMNLSGNNNGNSLMVYRVRDSYYGKETSIFPYYILSPERLLLISYDGTRCMLVNDASIVNEYHNRFEDVIASLNPIFLPAGGYMSLARELFYLNTHVDDTPVIFSADRPCFWQTVSPGIIEKYAQDAVTRDFALTYAQAVQSCPCFYTIFSSEGLKAFLNDGFVQEAGLNLQLDEADMTQVYSSLSLQKDKKMIQVPFESCIIHGWEIAVYYPNAVYIFPFDDPDRTIKILNREIIKAFFIFYNSLRQCCSLEKQI